MFPLVLCCFKPRFSSTFNRAPLSCSVPPPTFTLAECERKEGEGEWEGGGGENLAFTVRDQWYIMRGQTILLHAVSLTNDYTTKQYVHMMYESKAACQAWITIGQAQALNRVKRKIWELFESVHPVGCVCFTYAMEPGLPYLDNYLAN